MVMESRTVVLPGRGGEGILGDGGNVLYPQCSGDHIAAYISENSWNRKPEMGALHF